MSSANFSWCLQIFEQTEIGKDMIFFHEAWKEVGAYITTRMIKLLKVERGDHP
jgi:hypothetical protein